VVRGKWFEDNDFYNSAMYEKLDNNFAVPKYVKNIPPHWC
jgi:hypothetical protein